MFFWGYVCGAVTALLICLVVDLIIACCNVITKSEDMPGHADAGSV